MKLSFATKAQNLEQLKPIITNAIILPQVRGCVNSWRKNKNTILNQILNLKWDKIEVIIRSSAINEDAKDKSNAGFFTSILNVKGKKQIIDAIEMVIQDFKQKKDDNLKNQFFIQPQIKNVLLSGVAFSKCPTAGSPYIVVNYDDESGSTDSVTSGTTNNLKTFYYLKHSDVEVSFPMNLVIKLIDELEKLYSTDQLDIEFCITKDKKLYLFQVRPLIIPNQSSISSSELKKYVSNIYIKIKNLSHQHPYLHGTKGVFGIMPDWNPAEIIGIRPRPLALSLYKELITDNIWAYQRNNYGYKNLRSFPLLIDFLGLPYIDVRVSFNSFLPCDLEKELSDKLVNYYINKLISYPNYHDKVEFKIIFSCYTLDLPKRIKILHENGFTNEETTILMDKLRILTNGIIDKEKGIWKEDFKRIEELSKRYEAILNSSLDDVSKIYWLIEDCKRYGTLPFAGLARAGFIAVQFLQSLVAEDIFSKKDYDLFFNSLNSISSQMNEDLIEMRKDEFLNKYGHLRPGTYDLLSPNYYQAPDLYFDWNIKRKKSSKKRQEFQLSLNQMKKIEKLLIQHGLNHNIISFFDFIKSAIEGREYSKYIFTKSLNSVLLLFEKFAKEYNFSKEESVYGNIEIIKKLYGSSEDSFNILEESINNGKEKYKITKNILLPSLIIDPNDVFVFHKLKDEPNFITLLSSEGRVISVKDKTEKFDNAIMFIESADPGFDWIFSYNLKGFVTKYGGANSHMAIRAAELKIPAVIGAGEHLYNKWLQASILQLDCANKKVNIIK